MTDARNFKSYLVGGFAAIGGFLLGYHLSVISGVLTAQDFKNMIWGYHTNPCSIDSKHNLSYTNGRIIGILLFGCLLGSLMGGQTSDRLFLFFSQSVLLYKQDQ